MDERIVNISFHVSGMTCGNCELKIENTLLEKSGVHGVKADMKNSLVRVTMDKSKLRIQELVEAIEQLGYEAVIPSTDNTFEGVTKNKKEKNKSNDLSHLLGMAIIIVALYVIINNTIGFNFIPEIDQSMSYGILFVVGLLTSLHCIGMCGGICLSQCLKASGGESTAFDGVKPSLLYNLGRVVSYTAIGGIVGGVGRVVSFSGGAKGIVAIVAGMFMILMGINMLDLFPFLKRFNIKLPSYFGRKIYNNNGKHGSFYIGLLNGLMPCGPLQSMQLYALGTGSVAAGATSMLMFSLGTVPLMFLFGAVSSIFSKKFTKGLMKVSAVLVMFLGFIMLSRGMSLSGIAAVSSPVKGNIAALENGIQRVSIDLEPNRYSPIIVQQGVPVRFTINADAESLNGCNNAIVISKYGIQKKLEVGENIIEFTPDKEGDVPYSCWMGMIRSNIKVVSDIAQISSAEVRALNNAGKTGGISSGCCGSGGASQAASNSTAAISSSIDVEDIVTIKPGKDVQVIEVLVEDNRYSPAILVLQKNTTVQFKFNMKSSISDNGLVIFPEYRGQLDLASGDLETPQLDMFTDFGFIAGSGSFYSFVKIVEDVNKIDTEAIKLEAKDYINRLSTGSSCH